MIGEFSPSLQFLNNQVPLWFALLMAFSAPYTWATQIKSFIKQQFGKRTDRNE